MTLRYLPILFLGIISVSWQQNANAIWPFDAKDPNKVSIPQAVAQAGKAVIKAAEDGFTLSIETPDMKKALTDLKDLQLKPVTITIDMPQQPFTLEHKHTIPALPPLSGTLEVKPLEIKPIPEVKVSIDHFPNGAKLLKSGTLYLGSLAWALLGIKLLHDMALNPTHRTLFANAVMDSSLLAAAALFYAAFNDK